MPKTVKIDFVSDIACPWCAIGLASLEQALAGVEGEVQPQLHFEPFELNPDMPPGGEDILEHIGRKYGRNADQVREAQAMIRERGDAVGFTFSPKGRDRIWNTFDAHRLLYWAGEEGASQQLALKKSLLQAYHGEGRNTEDKAVLLDAVASAGLDVERARQILEGDEFAAPVKARERWFQQVGISAVPSVILNDKYLVQGGQPPELFREAILRAAAEAG